MRRLRATGYDVTAMNAEESWQGLVARMDRAGDALPGLVNLLAWTRVAMFGAHTGWLHLPELAARRRIVGRKKELKRVALPFFVKAAEAKGAPGRRW